MARFFYSGDLNNRKVWRTWYDLEGNGERNCTFIWFGSLF